MSWYIIKESEHLGPFNEEELEQLRRKNKLVDETLLWREGMEQAQTYADLFLDLPPDLSVEAKGERDEPPPLPFAREEEGGIFRVEQLEETPGKDTEEIFKTPEQASPREGEADENDSAPKIKTIPAKNKTRQKSGVFKVFVWTLFLLFAVAGVGAGWFFYQSKNAVFSRPAKMGPQDYERLKGVARLPGPEKAFAFAVARDMGGVWMAVNFPLEGKIGIKLTGIEGKLLSEGLVEASGESRLREKLVFFDAFTFQKGQRLAQGWYDVEVFSADKLKAPWPLGLLSLESFPEFLLKHIPWAKGAEFSRKEKSLLTVMRRNDFQKALAREKQRKRENDTEFWGELKQKYLTVRAIALRVREAMDKVFDKDAKEWDRHVKDFEEEYSRNYGNFFTNFVLQNEKSYEGLAHRSFSDKTEVISFYARLSDLAKNVGKTAMSSLLRLQALSSDSSEEEREGLRKEIRKGFEDLVQEALRKLDQIQAKLPGS